MFIGSSGSSWRYTSLSESEKGRVSHTCNPNRIQVAKTRRDPCELTSHDFNMPRRSGTGRPTKEAQQRIPTDDQSPLTFLSRVEQKATELNKKRQRIALG